jgi:NAD(P)-dependent dehydrogenase (short-subunit alcohol dehydrogenase family)
VYHASVRSIAPPVASLLDLSGRVALVTGAAAGIGAGIASRLAEAGATVIVHYRSNREGAEQVADAIDAAGGRALVGCADLTVADEVERLFDAATDMLGLPSIVVNNAGAYPISALTETPEREWSRVIDANLKSVHLVTQAAAQRLIAAGEPGAIVNIASIEASNAARGHAHYSAAKAAVVMYTKTAALELGPAGVRVNAVSPGLIHRDGLDEAWPDGVRRYRAAAPLARLGEPLDVADACLFLASPAARWITGIELVVDGGVLVNTAY